jgi:hypothetical protein
MINCTLTTIIHSPVICIGSSSSYRWVHAHKGQRECEEERITKQSTRERRGGAQAILSAEAVEYEVPRDGGVPKHEL